MNSIRSCDFRTKGGWGPSGDRVGTAGTRQTRPHEKSGDYGDWWGLVMRKRAFIINYLRWQSPIPAVPSDKTTSGVFIQE